MSSSNFTRPIATNKAALSQLGNVEDPLPLAIFKDESGVYKVPADQMTTGVTNQTFAPLTPSNANYSTIFSTGGTLEFRFSAAPLDDVDDLRLKLVVTNSDASNSVTLLPAPLLIDRVQIFGQGGAVQLGTDYPGEMLYLQKAIFTTQEQWNAEAQLINASTTHGAGTAIAASGTQNLYINIPGFWAQCNIFWPAVEQDFILKVKFRSGAFLVTAGTGTPVLSSASLLFEVNQLSNRMRDDKARDLKNGRFKSRITYIIPQSYSNQTVTASQKLSLKLDGVNGIIDYLVAVIRAPPTSGAQIGTFVSLGNGTVEITDANGANVIGGSPVDYSILRYSMPQALGLNTSAFNDLPIIMYSHSKSPKDTYDNAELKGFAGYDGKNYFNITPGSTFSTGTYNIDIYAVAHGWLEINAGNIAFSQS